MYNVARLGFILLTALLLFFAGIDLFYLHHPLQWPAVIAEVIMCGSFFVALRYKHEPQSQWIVGICFVLQALIAMQSLQFSEPVYIPFIYHLVGGGVSILVLLVLNSFEPGPLKQQWPWIRMAVGMALIMSWIPFFSPVSSSFTNAKRSETWFRVSHGFYPWLPLFLTGPSPMSHLYVKVEEKDGQFFFDGNGPYDGLLVKGFDRDKPFLVSKGPYKDCIDGHGRPYFRDAALKHRFFEISRCGIEQSDTFIALEGTTYKVVRMDGSEVRTLPYEVIDLDPRGPSDNWNGMSKDDLLQARRDGLWGLIDMEGNERLAPMSATRLRREMNAPDLFRITRETGVGLAGPGRGIILPPVYKEFRIASAGPGEEAQKNWAENYSGVLWVKNQSDEWGLLAAHPALWLITPGKLVELNRPQYTQDPGFHIDVQKAFQIKGGQWLFMGQPVAKMHGQQLTYDYSLRSFVTAKNTQTGR